MNKLIQSVAVGALILSVMAACTPSSPNLVTPDGQKLEGDRGISGKVTGDKVGPKSKVAIFGAFTNISGNKIDATNQTIQADTTLATAPVNSGAYSFSLPKAPQKAQGAIYKIFAFNDDNGNSKYDEGELKSKEATMSWSVVTGYSAAVDADGNPVILDPLSPFKDFNFKLGS